ncbi:MAG: PhzF family phenazine biosynthesis protein [Candidatus Hodarchaeales archaeon]|jgi:trans-2,3-dihydro-3-hydroxyanthranilate isomerase
MRSYHFIQTSVFTDERYAFSGNQLATFWNISDSDLTDDEMLGITREMNFSETTFVLPSDIDKCIRSVRIFTPGQEIPFAGHPTLGTAYVLKNKGIVKEEDKNIYLELGVGPIRVSFAENNYIRMQQPIPKFLEEFSKRKMVAEILGISENDISNMWPMRFVSTGLPFLIVPLISLKSVQSIKLNIDLLLETLKEYPSQQLLIFCSETIHSDSNIHMRMFAPSVGVIEDPATGSAVGPLGAYIDMYNVIKELTQGAKIIIEQGYEINRPSRLIVKCRYDSKNISSVIVEGQVRKTAEGVFFL